MRGRYGEDVAKYIADEYWIPPAANRGELMLTKDDRIRRLPDIAQIAFRTRARIFCLPNAQMTTTEMRQRFLTNLDRIIARGQRPGPCIYAVDRQGLHKLWP